MFDKNKNYETKDWRNSKFSKNQNSCTILSIRALILDSNVVLFWIDLYPCTTSYSLLQVLLRNPFLDLHCSLQSIFLKWNQVQGLSQLQTSVSTTWSYQDRLMKLHYHLKRNFLHCTIMHFWIPFMVYFE